MSIDKKLETLSYVLLFKVKHQYGKVKFVDKNNQLIQVVDVKDTSNISTKFYEYSVQYNELLPTDNPYSDEVVSCIKFVDYTKDELRKKNNY